MKGKDTFIVELWSSIFHVLRKISVFQILRCLFPNYTRTHRFVDIWILFNTFLSLILLILFVNLNFNEVIIWIAFWYGLLRVFEIIVYQINVLLFDDIRSIQEKGNYSVKSYRRMVLLLLHNYVEIVGWFAITYFALQHTFDDIPDTVLGMIYYSFTTMASFSSGLNPITNFGILIITMQSFIGLFMTLISLARFISLFPKPDTQDEREK